MNVSKNCGKQKTPKTFNHSCSGYKVYKIASGQKPIIIYIYILKLNDINGLNELKYIYLITAYIDFFVCPKKNAFIGNYANVNLS